MGVFDRLGNLGKGMVGIIKSGAEAPSRFDTLEEEMAALKAKAGVARTRPQSAALPKGDQRLEQLRALHAEGLLSDQEYSAKLAALAGRKLPDPHSSYVSRQGTKDSQESSAESDAQGPDTGDSDSDGPRLKKTL